MDRIHEYSTDSHKSEVVGIFKVPTTQVDIESGYWEVIRPTQTLDNATVVEFNADAGPFFTDLANSYIKIRLSVSSTAGAILANVELSLTNLIAHSLWSKINLYVSGEDVSGGDRGYPYIAMLLTLLGKNSSWLPSGQLEGFYADTATHMNDYAAANTGFVSRKALVVSGAVGNAPTIVEVVMRPYIGAFQLDRLIPDRTEIRLELTRSNDAFALINNDVAGAAIKLESVHLHLRRVRLSTSTYKQIDGAITLEKRALYPITRFKLFIKGFKSQPIDFTEILKGSIVTHAVVGFVATAAVQGSNKLNPFDFANFGVSRLQLTSVGINYPRTELTPQFAGTTLAGAQVAREYQRLLELAHKNNGPEGLLFSMADFPGGYALYGFDLTPDLDSGHYPPSYRGSLEIHGAFSAEPAANVSIILLAEVPSIWELNSDRSVTKDW